MKKKYLEIIEHYESCLDRHGDTHLGVDWPNEEDALLRHKIMTEVIREKGDLEKKTLLDFGCGTGHLYEYIQNKSNLNVEYTGLDFSKKFTDICNMKFPEVRFMCGDVLDKNFELNSFDYVVMNGVFTEKRKMTHEEMFDYFKKVIDVVFTKTNVGLAFNVMSKNVDWERDDLFHLSIDDLTGWLTKNISRNFIIRSDYGLYEYTVYVYRRF